MSTLICGSIAYDTIMVFHDRFKNHILPEKIQILNVAFLVPDMRREFGGCAGNIAYTLKMLGGEPLVMATVGEDAAPYASRMDALGLSRRQMMKLVILPQAMRVIIPPLTNQYLNLTKNSSLAVAIGYPDVVSISNTTLNQSGRAVECIAVIMVVYLSTSLSTSALMNWYNKRVAIKER